MEASGPLGLDVTLTVVSSFFFYHIIFTADDGKQNGTCEGQVIVSVPHDVAHKAVDSGAIYDSTISRSSAQGIISIPLSLP